MFPCMQIPVFRLYNLQADLLILQCRQSEQQAFFTMADITTRIKEAIRWVVVSFVRTHQLMRTSVWYGLVTVAAECLIRR